MPIADCKFQDALLESRATIQQIVQERDAEVDKTRELDNQLENLRKDYIQSLAEVSISYRSCVSILTISISIRETIH